MPRRWPGLDSTPGLQLPGYWFQRNSLDGEFHTLKLSATRTLI
jgi:hypothetical protein